MTLFVLGFGAPLGDLADPGSDDQGLLLDLDSLPKRVRARKGSRATSRQQTILSEVEAAVASWRSTAEQIGMTRQELDDFADAFEHDERLSR